MGSARVWDAATRELAGRRGTAAEPDAGPRSADPRPGARDELAALVAGVVRATLDTRLPECQGARRTELARELEARLLAIFGAAGAGMHAPPEPGGESGASPAALAAHEAPAGHGDPVPASSPAARALGLVLDERLSRLGGPLAERADLRARLVGLAWALLDEARDPAAASEAELRSLDLLQRRAAKLERSLQETRAVLAYVSGLEHVDEGLASIYRAVQGLALDDPRCAQKASVLELVFRANLELQKPAG